MKLKDLALKASKLPNLDFDTKGEEQWHDDVFKNTIQDFDMLKFYVRLLKHRVSLQSYMLKELCEAYMKMKDIILEAEVERQDYDNQ